MLATAPASSDPAAAPAFPEYYFRRHFIVMFDPLHDHATRWQYSIDDTGAVAATSARGELRPC